MVIEYFGLPGCGKTSLAAKTAVDIQRRIDMGLSKYKYVYTNVHINYPGIRLIEWSWIGRYDYTDACIVIDEIGLNAHSRSFDSFPRRMVEWFCTHRHDRVDLIYFAQYYNQADKVIREVTETLYYMKKSIFPHCTRIVKIPREIVIPKDTGEIKEGFRYPNIFERIFVGKWFYRKPYYQYFDSWEHCCSARKPARYTEVPGDPNPIHVKIRSFIDRIRGSKR